MKITLKHPAVIVELHVPYNKASSGRCAIQSHAGLGTVSDNLRYLLFTATRTPLWHTILFGFWTQADVAKTVLPLSFFSGVPMDICDSKLPGSGQCITIPLSGLVSELFAFVVPMNLCSIGGGVPGTTLQSLTLVVSLQLNRHGA